jgi:site-specific DNA recombinase
VSKDDSKDKDDDSREARSVGEQHDENRAVAERNGWTIVADYEDVMSASRFAAKARKDWPRLLADVEAGKLDVVILWESSRGSMIAREWIGFLDLCRERGVLVHVTAHRHTYDLRNRRDRKTLISDGVDAEDDSEKISETVRRALAGNAEDGMPHSQAPYGFRRVYAPRRERLSMRVLQVPVEAEAAIVRQVVAAVAAETPLSQIERDTGVRRSTIRKWCVNPAYIGKRRTPAGLVDARWMPIVREEIWHQAKAVLAGRPGAGKADRPGSVKYLLSSLALCSVCREKLQPDPVTKRRAAAYSCRTGHVGMVMAPVDEAVGWLVIARCAEPDLYALLTAASGTEAEAARADAERLQGELDDWLNAGVSARAYKVQEDRLLPLIAAARERADLLTIPAPIRKLATAAADAAEAWGEMTVAEKRAAIRFLFEWIELRPAPRTGKRPAAHERMGWEWRSFRVDPTDAEAE